MNDAEIRYLEIRKYFETDEASLKLLDNVYATAKKLHSGQTRQGGEPYIIHPVEVALILAKLEFNVNVNVICAALLHDVIEDCGYTLEEITNNFNSDIAQMVDCVSAIDKTKYVFDENEIYEDVNFIKFSAEEQTFKKLIAIGKKNPMGFAIKFADRLHNLRTVGCFDYNKQLEKVRESEKWIIPIAEKLNSEYFYRELSNECFKIVNRGLAKTFLEHYHTYHSTNKKNLENLQNDFKEIFSNSVIKDIKFEDIKEYKVYSDLKEIFPNENIGNMSQGQILKMANYNIYCLSNVEISKEIVEDILFAISKKLANKIKIIDVKIGRFTQKVYYRLEDNYHNKYNLYIMSKNDYIYQKVGTLDGEAENLIDDDNINNLAVKYIKIKTRTNEVKFLPENSTALDFAFKIHQDLGFGFKYAIINGSKTKQPPFTKLNDGDKIEVFVDRNEKNEILNNVQVKWLAYVNTEIAKKRLTKYFEHILNETKK